MTQITISDRSIIYEALIGLELELKNLIESTQAAINNLPMSEEQRANHLKCISMWRRELAQCLATQVKFKY